jgi:hypothetical protein
MYYMYRFLIYTISGPSQLISSPESQTLTMSSCSPYPYPGPKHHARSKRLCLIEIHTQKPYDSHKNPSINQYLHRFSHLSMFIHFPSTASSMSTPPSSISHSLSSPSPSPHSDPSTSISIPLYPLSPSLSKP